MGFVGLYFFALSGALFVFLWANLTNYKLPTARVLSGVAFLMLLWVLAKLMLVAGIGWENTRFWMLIMTAITWLLPAFILHFVIEIKRARPGKIYYHFGVFFTYFFPVLGVLSLFIFPFLMPTRYISINQWVWDGIFLPAINVTLIALVGVYTIAAVGILLSEKYSLLDIGLVFLAFLAFYLRFLLLFFDIAVNWSGWLLWQPLLVLVSYALLWIMYKKHFWLEASVSLFVLDKLLKNFSMPILIVKANKTIWYMNPPMKNLFPSSSFLSVEDFGSYVENQDDFLDIFRRLSLEYPIMRRLLRIRKESQVYTFYAHAEIISLLKKFLTGYAITLTPLESEQIIRLTEKDIKLHQKLEELRFTYQNTLQSLDIPLILMDNEWRVMEINHMAYKILGINQNMVSLKGEKLPLPKIIAETAPTVTDQRFLVEIDFEGREWKQFHSHRKGASIFEFHLKKIGENLLFILKDTSETSAQEDYLRFETRFYHNLYRLAGEIMVDSASSLWDRILDTFVNIFSFTGYIVSLSKVTNNEHVRIMGLRGIDQTLLEKVNNLMGGKLFSSDLHIPPHFSLERNIMLSGKLNKVSGGLQELFFYSLNPMISMMLEHIIGIHEIYSIGLSRGETIYGLLVVIIKKGHSFPALEWLEPFSEEVSQLIELKKRCFEQREDEHNLGL